MGKTLTTDSTVPMPEKTAGPTEKQRCLFKPVAGDKGTQDATANGRYANASTAMGTGATAANRTEQQSRTSTLMAKDQGHRDAIVNVRYLKVHFGI